MGTHQHRLRGLAVCTCASLVPRAIPPMSAPVENQRSCQIILSSAGFSSLSQAGVIQAITPISMKLGQNEGYITHLLKTMGWLWDFFLKVLRLTPPPPALVLGPRFLKLNQIGIEIRNTSSPQNTNNFVIIGINTHQENL